MSARIPVWDTLSPNDYRLQLKFHWEQVSIRQLPPHTTEQDKTIS